jgi:uncharacterized protein YhaN
MRFADLRLTAYGGFRDRVLAFPARELDFHILLGANEAGKTTALRALSALLFGFGHRIEDAYVFDARDLRVGATIENAAGGQLNVYRKRGRVRTLTDEADTPLPDDCLAPYLGGVEQRFFEMVFGLDHERLRQGGQELAQNRGDLAQSLFAAGAGVAGLRGTLEALRTDADALFKARGQNPVINSALRDYHDALGVVRAASVGASEWKRLSDEHARALKRQNDLDADLQGRNEEITRLERIQHNLPQLAQRSELLDKLAALAAVPDVRQEQVTLRQAAQQQARDAGQAVSRARAELARLEGELAGVHVDEKLLARAEEVQYLRDDRARMLSALKDLPGVQGQHEQIRSRIQDLLADAALAADVEGSPTKLPGSPARANLRALVSEHRSLSEARGRSEDALRDGRLKLEREQGALAALPPPVDTTALQDAVDAAADEGPLERELEQERADLDVRQRALEPLSATLHPWQIEPETLATLALPSHATVETYEARFRELDGQLGDAERKVAEATAEAEELRVELEALAADADLPTPEAIQDGRRVRDEGWRLLRRAFIDGEEDVGDDARVYDSRRPLPEAYEYRVAEADALADRRHAEAERIAGHQAASVRLDKTDKRVARLERALGRLQEERKEALGEWAAEWAALDGEPRSPAEMRAWLEARERVLEAGRELTAARERAERLERGIADARENLAAGLESAGLPRADQPDALAALLRAARKRLKAAGEAASQRHGSAERVGLLEESTASAQQRLNANEKETKEWRKRWGAAVKALKRDANVTPAEVEPVIARIEEIEKLEVERKQHAGRIEEMQTFIRTYQERADTVVAALAPHLVTVDALEAVATLGASLDESFKARDRCEQLHKDSERQQQALRVADRDGQEAAAELKVLCTELGCEDEAALLRTEEQAEEKARLHDDLERLERTVIDANRGHSIEETLAEARDIDGDALPGQITTLRERLEGLQGEQRQVSEEVGGFRGELARMDGNDQAARAAQTAEEKLAVIEGAAARYLRTEAAWLLLRRTIERYQERNQGPLLARAGSIFHELTLGSFEGLTVDYLDEGAVLLGARPGGTTLRLEDMSDGTRDQLYLALRLAAIERHLELHGPLPAVLDDILVNFDDERATATLRLLADLSRLTQVLFLSHHPHLVALAERELGKDTVAVQNL